jgi:hypothetical protein
MAVVDVRAMLARRADPPFGHVDVSESGRKSLDMIVSGIYADARRKKRVEFQPDDDGEDGSVQVAPLKGFDDYFQPDARWSLERVVKEIRAKGIPETLGAGEIRDGGWSFYAIRVADDKRDLVAVRAKSPTYGLSTHSKLMTRFIGNELKPVAEPLLSFDHFADLLVIKTKVFVLAPQHAEKLLVDADAVKARAEDLAQSFSAETKVKLTGPTIAAVERVCSHSANAGRRIEKMRRAGNLSRVTAASIRAALPDAGYSKDTFGKGGPIRVSSDAQAKLLIEIAADLFYKPRHEEGHRRVGSYRHIP